MTVISELRGRHRWARCATLADLAQVTVARMRAEVTIWPNGNRSPKTPASGPVADALVALNQIGFVVLSSSPLRPRLVTDFEHRAFVFGLADDEMVSWLNRAMYGTQFRIGTVYPLWEPNSFRPRGPGVEVSRYRNAKLTCVGGQMDADRIESRFRLCRRALPAIRRAWQVTIIDTRFDNGELFPFLLDICQRRTALTVAGAR
jgi:hypothetical protein